MKKLFLILLLLLGLLRGTGNAQEYSYAHYDLGEGLAGSTVYCIGQDRDGFMWFGTETGLSRFDGTHFRNFTTADGLPDLEILQIFGDSRDRIWMAPFRNAVCFYYEGKIHNQQNDSLLRSVRLKEKIDCMAEDAAGDVLLAERTALHLITRSGKVIQYDSLAGVPIGNCDAVSRSAAGNFLAQVDQRIIEFTPDRVIRSIPIHFVSYHPIYIALNPWWGVWRTEHDRASVRSFATGKQTSIPFQYHLSAHYSYTLIGDSLLYTNQSTDSRELNLRNGLERRLLPGKRVSRVFRDRDGNLWLATLGEGIYRENSQGFRTIPLRVPDGHQCIPYSICRFGDELLVGTDYQLIIHLSLPSFHMTTPYFDQRGNDRILFLYPLDHHRVISGSDFALQVQNTAHRDQPIIQNPVKSLCPMDSGRFLVGFNTGTFVFDPATFKLTDTLNRERATAVYAVKDTGYFSTLHGLYRVVHGQTESLGERSPLLRERITSIVRSMDGTLWMASPNFDGIIGYLHDSIVAHITTNQGLSGNLCRYLLVRDEVLWVGTDKGLNRIALAEPGHPVKQYTSNDGSGSDLINCIYADGHTIYVGTSKGLNYFDERQVPTDDPCRLRLLALINGGKDRLEDSGALQLPYQDKAVRFEYAGISYRSAGKIRYRYRMEGLDTIWRETGETSLDYPALPAGGYRFQLQAINAFGTRSAMLSLPFNVQAAWWETRWFQALVLIVVLLIIWAFISWRIRRIRIQQQVKEAFQRERAEMENRALLAQMNPHFIFNCLNSIQQFVFGQDMLATNEFITGFARLIRATLRNSSESLIAVGDEVDYLTTYLSLEKMRFKEKMDYHIQVDPALDRQKTFLPPMMIQPYVENAMRHGLRHKTGGDGLIRIDFRTQNGRLLVVVEDNGIGRRQAEHYKTREHIEYQSRGMSLTAGRMKSISAVYGDDIQVTVEDRLNEQGQPQGTRVIIRLPELKAPE